MEAFADKLQAYKTSKGAIQFPYNKPLPLELIKEIALWCDAGAITPHFQSRNKAQSALSCSRKEKSIASRKLAALSGTTIFREPIAKRGGIVHEL